MGRGDQLAAFEQLVLLAIVSLEEEGAYGMNIRLLLLEKAGRDVAVPTVYSALDRLESKGFVTSRLGDPTAARGGRAKKLYQVEQEGAQALREVRRAFQTLWDLGGLTMEPGGV